MVVQKEDDMDGVVHTFKSRLVVKAFTQTYRVDYEETFSLVADFRAIRILIAIAVYYDYEIWQMDVKTAFLNGHLSKEVYMEQLEDVKPYLGRSFVMKDLGEAAYILGIKRFHMENSKRGSIPMQEKLRVSKSQGASTPAELKHMQNVPYALVVGSIIFHMENSKRGSIPMQEKLRVSKSQGASTPAELKHMQNVPYALVVGSIMKFISRLGVVPIIEEPINMYCDNTGAIVIDNEPGITKGARHFHAKVYYLHAVIEYGNRKLEKVYTYDNLADPFTKALAFPKHSEHTRNIRMLPVSPLT
nr:hypothetical protein [Tanacetum cinerariifolium]